MSAGGFFSQTLSLLDPRGWNLFRRKIPGLSIGVVGNKGPVWLNTIKPYEWYNTVPQYKTVIDRKSAMFSNMQMIIVDRKTKAPIDDSYTKEFYKLMNKPNVMHSFNSFLKEYKTHEQVFGNSYLYKNIPTQVFKDVLPVALWNISPKYMRAVLTGKMFDQVEIEGIIQYYEYTDGTIRKEYKTSEVMPSRLQDLDDPAVGQPMSVSLLMALTNIKHAMDYRNVIMAEKGGIGILSNKSRDSSGAVPLSKDEKKKLQDAYIKDFGIKEGQSRVHITEASMEWQPMSYPTKDLLLFEEVDADFETIICSLGLNINMFLQSTYENVKHGIVNAYQDTIQPDADQFCQAFAEFIGMPKQYELIASYEHIPALKEAKLEKMKGIDSLVGSFTKAIQSGLMSQESAISLLSTELDIEVYDGSANKTLTALNKMSPLVANKILDSMTLNQKLQLIGLPAVDGGDTIQPPSSGNVFANVGG